MQNIQQRNYYHKPLSKITTVIKKCNLLTFISNLYIEIYLLVILKEDVYIAAVIIIILNIKCCFMAKIMVKTKNTQSSGMVIKYHCRTNKTNNKNITLNNYCEFKYLTLKIKYSVIILFVQIIQLIIIRDKIGKIVLSQLLLILIWNAIISSIIIYEIFYNKELIKEYIDYKKIKIYMLIDTQNNISNDNTSLINQRERIHIDNSGFINIINSSTYYSNNNILGDNSDSKNNTVDDSNTSYTINVPKDNLNNNNTPYEIQNIYKKLHTLNISLPTLLSLITKLPNPNLYAHTSPFIIHHLFYKHYNYIFYI